MGFRTRCPRWWHPGIVNASSWRRLSQRQVQKVTDAPPSPSPLRQAINPSWERCPPQRQRDTEKNPSKQARLSFPQFTTLTSPSLTFCISVRLPAFQQTQQKSTQGWRFLRVFISLWRLPRRVKFISSKRVCFSAANLSLWVWFSGPARDPKRVQEHFFLPYRWHTAPTLATQRRVRGPVTSVSPGNSLEMQSQPQLGLLDQELHFNELSRASRA